MDVRTMAVPLCLVPLHMKSSVVALSTFLLIIQSHILIAFGTAKLHFCFAVSGVRVMKYRIVVGNSL